MEQSMDCNHARQELWPPERLRLADPEILAARAHVDACAECLSYFAQDRILLDAYHRLGQVESSPGTREAIFAAVERARRGDGGEAKTTDPEKSSRKRWSVEARLVSGVGATAAVVLLVAFFADGYREPGGAAADSPDLAAVESPAGTSAGSVFVEDYLRRAVGEEHIETSDPGEVRSFLLRELGVPFVPLQMAGLSLERAEICLIRGRRGAMIVYKRRGVAVSHYIVPRDEAPVRVPSLSRRQSVGEPPVVTWSSGSLEQALVGEMAPAELLEMAGSGQGY